MTQRLGTLFLALALGLLPSCNSSRIVKQADVSGSADQSRRPNEAATDNLYASHRTQASFEDQTQEILGHAKTLIETNQKEGAVLDQRWYGLKYFGKHEDLIFNAVNVMFFGGLENDVRNQLLDQYRSLDPVEDNQDSGDIRLYTGKRKDGNFDFIVIGQNGKEVALKTIIRLLYLAKFVDAETRQKYRQKIESFDKSLKVLMSSVSAKQEYIAFFTKHGITNPDAVMIGFRGDIRSLLKDDGVSDPESYTDESLRVNWYPDANGKKVLLVSIDKNRIFASRSGELIQAILEISSTPPSVTFLGAAGAIDAPEMVGKIVAPTSVMDGDSFPASPDKGVLVQIVRNRAAVQAAIKTADVSVDSVLMETTKWVERMKAYGVKTVDQELFHIINAINSSEHAGKVEIFAGHLVTDNVSSNANDTDLTLEHAEEIISATSEIRKEFLSKTLTKIAILKNRTSSLPRRSQSLEMRRPFRLVGE